MTTAEHIKTVREALDAIDRGCHTAASGRGARAALDSLEAELAQYETNAAAMSWQHDSDVQTAYHRIVALEAELATLRARLAPADSPPVDEELRGALSLVGGWAHEVTMLPTFERAFGLVLRAAEAHLRSQQPESDDQRAPLQWRDPGTAQDLARVLFVVLPGFDNAKPVVCLGGWDAEKEAWLDEDTDGYSDRLRWYPGQVLGWLPLDALPPVPLAKARDAEGGLPPVPPQQPESDDQRAERELGAWLVAQGNRSWMPTDMGRSGYHVSLYERSWEAASTTATGPTKAAAILDALAKARDAEGGKSAAGRLDEVLDALPFGIGRKVDWKP